MVAIARLVANNITGCEGADELAKWLFIETSHVGGKVREE